MFNGNNKYNTQATQEEGIGTEQYFQHKRHIAWVRWLIGLGVVIVVSCVAIAIQGLMKGNSPFTQGAIDFHYLMNLKTKGFRFSDLSH